MSGSHTRAGAAAHRAPARETLTPSNDPTLIAAAARERAAAAAFATGDHARAEQLAIEAALSFVRSGANADALRALDAVVERCSAEHSLRARRFAAVIAGDGGMDDAIARWNAVADHADALQNTHVHAEAAIRISWLQPGSTPLLRDTDRDSGWAQCGAAREAMQAGTFAEIAEYTRGAIDAAVVHGDKALEAHALSMLAVYHAVHEDLGQAIATQQLAIEAARDGHETYVMFGGVGNLVHMLALDLRSAEARIVARDAMAQARDRGLDGWYATCTALVAWLAAVSGATAHARSLADEAVAALKKAGDDSTTTHVGALLAAALSEIGDERGTHSVIELAERAAERIGSTSLSFDLMHSRVRLGMSQGRTDDLLVNVEAMAATGNDIGITQMARSLMHAGLLLSDERIMGEARRLANEVHNIHARQPQLCLEELMATTSALDSGDVDEMLSIAERWNAAHLPIEAARTLIDVAMVHHRHGRTGEAVPLLMDAQRSLLEMGVVAELELVTNVLAALPQVSADAAAPLDEARMLAGLSAAERAQIDEIMATSTYAAGKVFYEPGEDQGMVYFLRDGHVRLSHVTADGKRLTVATLDPGAVFGEGAALGRATAGLTAEATTDVKVGVMRGAHLREVIARIPRVGLNLLEEIGERIERTQRLTERVAFWNVSQRITGLLLDLDEQYGHPTLDGGRIINRVFTQAELAEMVHARRESVSEHMSQLKRDGLIDMRKRRIVLRDVASMRAALNGDA